MGKGSYRRRADKKRVETYQANTRDAQAQLAAEREREVEAERLVAETTMALQELADLRAEAANRFAADVAALKEEIRELADSLTQVKTESVGSRSVNTLAAQMILGRNASTETMAWLMEEAERRVCERYPDEYKAAPKPLVLSTISKRQGLKLGNEAIRIIERARANKGQAYRQGDRVPND